MLPPFIGPSYKGSPSTFSETISVTENDYNLLARLGFVPITPLTATLTVNAVVGSSAASIPAMDLRGLPAGSTINLTNTAHILGCGGAGGDGNFNGDNGEAGGVAIYGPGPGVTLNITNVAGQVWGGGGGGGGGGYTPKYFNPYEPAYIVGSGGGGGAGGGAGGDGSNQGDYGPTDPGAAGTGGAAGAGGLGGTEQNDGGNGAAYGAAGSNGVGTSAGTGGAAGYYVRSAGGTVNWVSGGANVAGSAD